MTNIPPIARDAIELARRGDFERAIATARRAVDAHPSDPGIRMFLAILHLRRTELGKALPHLRAAVAGNPAEPLPRIELIRVLIGLNELDEAAALLDQAQLPGTEPLRLRAMLLQRRGDVAEAAGLYEQVVSADAKDFESWGNLGHCRLASDQIRSAIAAFNRSLALRPDRPSVRQKWGEAHFRDGTGEQALAELRELAGRSSWDPNLWIAIAHLHNLLSRPDQSFEALEEAVRVGPSSADALIGLAEALEQRNDLQRLESVVAQLAALEKPVDRLPLLQARLAYRRGDYEKALALARSAAPSNDTGTRAQLIGQSLDRLGDPSNAFDAFVEMNREDARAVSAVSDSAAKSRAELAAQRSQLTLDWVAGWRQAAAPLHREPAFLVGFPRSGTTLLDTLLMGHPATAVAEEEPMLSEVGKRVGDLSRLPGMEAGEVESLRRLYFEIAKQHVPEAREQLLVDKNPLAMGSIPVIHRLFPAAPLIFMERHPCDVVLSCFMTRFQPTGLGTNFVTLEDTALLYDEMARLWATSAEIFPVNTRSVRYERLVEDPEAELRPLADFLELEWMPQLLDHRATAKRRTFIKTPSYAQVTEPLNAKAVGRWTHYRKQMDPVLPILETWTKRLGYEL